MENRIFYIADLHFGHRGMLKSRPDFAAVEEMDAALLAGWRWEGRIRAEDTVYILGDLFAYRENLSILGALPGQKVLVRGNHEEAWLHRIRPEDYFRQVSEGPLEIEDEGRRVVLSHVPRPELWPGEDGWLIHGHVHGIPRSPVLRALCARPNVLDAGVDVAAYTTGRWGLPATLDDLIWFNTVWRNDKW